MPCGFIIKNALDETAGMRYSVCVSGKSLLAYYSPAGNDRVLQLLLGASARPLTL